MMRNTPGANNNKNVTVQEEDTLPHVQVILSRSSYRVGETVVGTILVRSNPKNNVPANNNNNDSENDDSTCNDVKSLLKSLVVYTAGFCRIDPRWHNVSEYSNLYGKVHPQLGELYREFDEMLLKQGNNNDTVCFWATEGIKLLKLKERSVGNDVIENENETLAAFTFRADLPMDVPPSLNATTCRYYYSTEVLFKTDTQQRVIKSPFVVVTNPNSPFNDLSGENTIVHVSGRVKIGLSAAVAHSHGYPCHVSANELHRPTGQMTVKRSVNNNYHPNHPKQNKNLVQTLRVSNAQGLPVCIMTIVGSCPLIPGSRVHLKWEFPTTKQDMTAQGWVPCRQVSACLQGQEYALYEDGTTNRTRSIIFDTCHEYVEPGTTDRICHSLLLPLDAPCTVRTDLMTFSADCIVDITVEEPPINNNNNNQQTQKQKQSPEYNNMRLEIPCTILHSLDDDTMAYEEDITDQVLPLTEILPKKMRPTNEAFEMHDIIQDLKILSLEMQSILQQEQYTSK